MTRSISIFLTGVIVFAAAQVPQYENAAIGRLLGVGGLMTPMTAPVSYTAYKGNGSVADGWPDQTQWLDFRSMWFLNQNFLIKKVCDNTDAETADLYNAIVSVGNQTTVDPRFILSIVMEESRGCVNVQTTSYSVSNPGLMQSYEGKGSCVNQSPCPSSEIVQMIKDGTASNTAGVDLQDLLVRAGTTDSSRFYIAARMYNSGKNSIGAGGQLSVGGANACYASDVANRLIGYVGGSCGKAG